MMHNRRKELGKSFHEFPKRGTIAHDIYTIEVDDLKIGLMINLLVETLASGGVHASSMVILKVLRHLTERNFTREEAIMAARSYPTSASHTGEHRMMLDYLDGLIVMLEIASGEEEVDAATVSQFISRWHAQHAIYGDGVLLDFLGTMARDQPVGQADGP